jgi:hypothetical protein
MPGRDHLIAAAELVPSPAAADRRYTMYAMFEAWVG